MSNPEFSSELSYTLEAAFKEAIKRKHPFFLIEHVLFSLTFEPRILEILDAVGADPESIRRKLEVFFDEHVKPQMEKISKESAPMQAPAIDRVLQRAFLQVASSGRELVSAQDILVAILSEEDGFAKFFLAEEGVSKLSVTEFLSHGIRLEKEISQSVDTFDDDGDEFEEDRFFGGKPEKGSFLAKYAENLTLSAQNKTLDPLIGREKEVERTLLILSRRQKNNPLFLGEAGVGKTALASGIAQRIVSGEVPEQLKNASVFSLSIGSLIAGTKFRGEFEDRLKKLISELTSLPNAILFIDEIHTIMGAGSTGTGSLDVANLLKPALASGKLKIMGSTTHDEYKKTIEKDKALSRRFSIIHVEEPSEEDTFQILCGLKDAFEKHHNVSFTKSGLRAAVVLSKKHIAEKLLPDKAIDVIDEAGAANSLLSPSKRKEKISEKEIEEAVAKIARVPIQSVSKSDKNLLRDIEKRLSQRVFGQTAAIKAVSQAVKRRRANITQERKPVGSFLFAGPTGVGKTELAKALSETLGVHFHRFDMSEYMEKHAVSRLVGAPPGYVGYEEGGQLTDLIRKHPYAVVLFDEIEKAHDDIYPILLQVMDDATLTDAQGRKADFRNAVLIVTTNAGSEKSGSLGFGDEKERSKNVKEEAIKKLFKPEFRNRLDEIVYFVPLSPEIIESIVRKFLDELSTQLKTRNVSLEINDEVVRFLAQEGFDPLLGARPLQRTIQKKIKDPLSDELLFGKLEKGGRVRILMKNNEIFFEF